MFYDVITQTSSFFWEYLRVKLFFLKISFSTKNYFPRSDFSSKEQTEENQSFPSSGKEKKKNLQLIFFTLPKIIRVCNNNNNLMRCVNVVVPASYHL